jgi:hypothetical protein
VPIGRQRKKAEIIMPQDWHISEFDTDASQQPYNKEKAVPDGRLHNYFLDCSD